MRTIYLIRAVDKEIYNYLIRVGVKENDIEYKTPTRILWAHNNESDALEDCQRLNEKYDMHKYYIQEIDLY